jgi:hypothetical protein
MYYLFIVLWFVLSVVVNSDFIVLWFVFSVVINSDVPTLDNLQDLQEEDFE